MKICSLHQASTQLDVGYVDKDTENQVINTITGAVEISPLLAIKSWLIIYAKYYINVTHNSTASKSVLKTSYKMKPILQTFLLLPLLCIHFL